MQDAIVTATIAAMRDRLKNWFWTFVTWATAFAVVAIIAISLVQVSKFLVEIDKEPKIELKLEARAALMGNIVGAVFAGLVAVAAAFGAVYLERAGEREKIRSRQRTIVASLRGWAIEKVDSCSAFIDLVETWFDNPELGPRAFARPINAIGAAQPLPKLREMAETEYPNLGNVFAAIDERDAFFSLDRGFAIDNIAREIREKGTKIVAASFVIQTMSAVDTMLRLIEAFGDQVSERELASLAMKTRLRGGSSSEKLKKMRENMRLAELLKESSSASRGQ